MHEFFGHEIEELVQLRPIHLSNPLQFDRFSIFRANFNFTNNFLALLSKFLQNWFMVLIRKIKSLHLKRRHRSWILKVSPPSRFNSWNQIPRCCFQCFFVCLCMWDPTSVGKGNKIFLTKVWKPLFRKWDFKPWGWWQFVTCWNRQHTCDVLGLLQMV